MVDLSVFDLSGKKAFVTGGAQGIGRACAVALAMGGADVAIVGRNRDSGERTAASIRSMGGDAVFVKCDVSDESQVESMIAAVVRRFGRLDIAVNNAGAALAGKDETQSREDWEHVIGVNLTGTWLCARHAMRQMIRQQPSGGKIINVASIAGTTAGGNGSYDASKAAVVHLTKTLALQWGRYNINVNSISPGFVIGAFGSSRSLESRELLRRFTPLGHVQRAEDLHGPLLFLASRASDYMTGQNLIVDGGNTLSNWMRPLERDVPPRVSPDGEVAELKRDLHARGIAHDEDGIVLR